MSMEEYKFQKMKEAWGDANQSTQYYGLYGKGVTPERQHIVNVPEPSDWECYLFGGDTFKWVPSKGKEPNWFWRKMQYLFFGNLWVKKEKNT